MRKTLANISAETLHQAFELIKTILGRISKSKPDLSTDTQLESTLLELDKFCRRVSSAYKSRISDDMLFELSDLVNQFDLPIDDGIQFIKEVKGQSPEVVELVSSDAETVSSKLRAVAIKDRAEARSQSTQQKNAFAMMMKKAGGTYSPSEGSSRAKTAKPPKPRQMTLDEFEEADDLLDNLSANDLDILERRAQHTSTLKSSSSVKPRPKEKLLLNVVPKLYPEKKASTSTSYKSKFMRDLSKEHKAQLTGRAPPPIVRLPNAAAIGTGIGAYTGPPKPAAPKVPVSDSSDSESSSSDEENKGLNALLARQKGANLAPKPAAPQRFTISENRSAKILGMSTADIMRQREEARRRAHAATMRLRPDMTPLFRYVLGWNPQHTGPTPPYTPKAMAELGTIQPVPTTFSSSQHYDKVMQPMFLQELWAQFSKEESNSPPVTIEVMQKDYEDDFIDLQCVVTGNVPPGFFLNDSDVVTIVPGQGGRHAFAKVIMFRRKYKDVAVKIRILREMDPNVGVKGKLVLQKHASWVNYADYAYRTR